MLKLLQYVINIGDMKIVYCLSSLNVVKKRKKKEVTFYNNSTWIILILTLFTLRCVNSGLVWTTLDLSLCYYKHKKKTLFVTVQWQKDLADIVKFI